MKVLLHFDLSAGFISNAFEEKLGKTKIDSFILGDNIQNFDLDKYDLIVLQSESFFDKHFNKILNYKTSAIKIFIDMNDDFFIRRIYHNNNINLYFKRELYKDMSYLYKFEWSLRYIYGMYIITPTYRTYNIYGYINPLSFACNYAIEGRFKKIKSLNLYSSLYKRNNKSKRDIDLSFMMNITNISKRAEVYNFLKQSNVNNKIKLFMPQYIAKDIYFDKLSHSKASISIRGMGWDTFRYWEIPSNGAMLISQQLPIVIQNNFVDNESALFFRTNEDLYKKIKRKIISSDEWQEIARNGNDMVLKYHTPKRRAEYIINSVKEIQ